jgi:uncharacterized HAD superfamily protein
MKTIAVDIDDVLAASAEGFAEYSNQQWGHTLTAEDFSENFSIPWGVEMDEALQRVNVYLQSGAHGRFKHKNDALPVLEQLKQRFKLIAVTSRRAILKPETEVWMQQYFPGIFSDVVYAGIFDKTQTHNAHQRLAHTKAQILTELKANYLIDDHPKHCLGAAEVGIPSLLFGDYAWNRDIKDLPKNVSRAKTWADVEDYFSHVES